MPEAIPETLSALAVPVEGLRHYGKNPRRGNVDAIVESLRVHGQYRPVVVNRRTNEVLAGNHTLKAAKLLGWTSIAATFVDVDDEQAARIVLVDNRSNDVATYDDSALADLLQSLPDLGGTGFSDRDLDELLASVAPEGSTGGSDPDDVPEPPSEAVSVLGDVWLLGPHRLLCGDSTDLAAVDALLDGAMADCVFTDPPYNADYSSRVDKARRKPWGGIANDNMTTEAFDAFLVDIHSTAWAKLKAGGAVYLWTDWKRYPQVARVFAEAFTHKSTIVWDKGHFGLGTYYRTQYELALFGVKGEKLATWNAGHDERDVWTLARDPLGSYVHPTQKPVALATRALENSSDAGEVVLDLFGGSGSTLIAAHQTGRAARVVELDPRYVDVICRRYQEHTGTKPVLQSTGEPHDFAS